MSNTIIIDTPVDYTLNPDYEVTITFDGEPIQCSNLEILSNTSIEYVYTNDNSDYDIVYNFDTDTEEK